jgi:hypothetical protein
MGYQDSHNPFRPEFFPGNMVVWAIRAAITHPRDLDQSFSLVILWYGLSGQPHKPSQGFRPEFFPGNMMVRAIRAAITHPRDLDQSFSLVI